MDILVEKFSVFVVFCNVFFVFGFVEFKQEFILEFNQFKFFLEDNLEWGIIINGYIDNVGEEVDNFVLFEVWAKVVCDYLVFYGINFICFGYKGYGESWLIVINEMFEGCVLNWCIEFEIVK